MHWLAGTVSLYGRLREADVQHEVSEPEIQDSSAGLMDDERQQDDGEDDDHQPEEEHNDSGDRVPGYGSRSSHGLQLPGLARLIRNGPVPAATTPGNPDPIPVHCTFPLFPEG